MFDTKSDDEAADEAVNVINQLFSDRLLDCLHSKSKLALINAVLSGFAEDEEEQATLKILEASKNRSSIAEFLQLVAGETWEKLDSSIDSQEHDSLIALFNF